MIDFNHENPEQNNIVVVVKYRDRTTFVSNHESIESAMKIVAIDFNNFYKNTVSVEIFPPTATSRV